MLYYLYSGDELLGFIYNNNTYYYHKNLFGDIIGIYDSNYNEIVTYKYNSWGVIKNITDNSNINLGIINPFRYRSYYYDEETQLYYLNSRYYNPVIGRFINADVLLGTDGMNSYNLFSYCSNEPIKNMDIDGTKKTSPVKLVNRMKENLGEFAKKSYGLGEKKAKTIIKKVSNFVKETNEFVEKSFVLEVKNGSGINFENANYFNGTKYKYKNKKWETYSESSLLVSGNVGILYIEQGEVLSLNMNEYVGLNNWYKETRRRGPVLVPHELLINGEYVKSKGIGTGNISFVSDDGNNLFIGVDFSGGIMVNGGIKIGIEVEK